MTLLTAQDMIIKGTLIAKDKDIKVAISVEITVTSVYYQFEFTDSDWHINCQSIEVYFLPLRSDNNQQPIAI